MREEIDEKKAEDKDIWEFCLDCHKWLMATVCMLVDNTAIQYTLARNLAFLDHR